MIVPYLLSILFGMIQGLTEFLPISSSGHLLLLHEWLSLETSSTLSFDVALHVGTLLAVVIYFRQDLWGMLQALVIRPRSEEGILAASVVVGTLPAALTGWFLEDWITLTFRSPYLVAAMLVLIGLVMIIVERTHRAQRPLSTLTWSDAILMGCAQAVSLIPGTSRSGITIIAGMARQIKRADAARFSFYLSVPVIAGAGVKKGIDLLSTSLPLSELLLMLIGILASFVTGIVVIQWLLNYLGRRSLLPFAIYRIGLGMIVFLLLWMA
jgi:undecaprenyl-diphosphatase